MRDWRRNASLLAWVLTLVVAIMAAALAVVLAEALLQQLPTARGVWKTAPFLSAAVIVVIGIFFMLRSGFGWGAICGSGFRVPPAWLVGIFAVLAFWGWLWLAGPAPCSRTRLVPPVGIGRLEAIFTHGWIWLWGAVISCGIALAVWQAVFPRMLARYGNHLRKTGWLGKILTPLPISTQTPVQTVPSDTEFEYWLQGNDEPMQAGEKSLFSPEPSPQRIIASLRPAHLYGTARTLALIGQRGAGKSSLLRLAEGSPEAKKEVELRFVYVSLWEYKTAQAAIESMIEKVLHEVRDKIDIFPFTGAAGAFIRGMTGDGRFQWLTDTLALRVSGEDILCALSTALLLTKLRVIICVEDEDRVEGESHKSQFVGLITGAMDFFRLFPGFGYVICVSSSDWNALKSQATSKVEDAAKREARHSELSIKSPVQGLAKDGADLVIEEIRSQFAASQAAAEEQLQEFDTTRLCREDLVISPLRPEQWGPVLNKFREKMLENSESNGDPEAKRFGFSNGDRKASWDAFIKAVKSPATDPVPFNPEFGIIFTPRTLRRGLADAWRKWSAIKQVDPKIVIDPDSVLVACLLRVCRPDVWNTLIRTPGLAEGADWPLSIIVRPSGNRAKDLPLAHLEDFPHLGLNPPIRNILLKTLVRKPSIFSEDTPAPVRPGGLIGTLPGESDPGANWRLFLNA